MKLKLLLYASLLMLPAAMNASSPNLVILLNESEPKAVYAISDIGRVYFESDGINVNLSSGVSETFGFATFSRIFFDNEGLYKPSSITQSLISGNSFKVYPNPASDWIAVEGCDEFADLRVFSIDGKMLLHKEGYYAGDKISVSHLAKGIYILNVGNKSIKFIKS